MVILLSWGDYDSQCNGQSPSLVILLVKIIVVTLSRISNPLLQVKSLDSVLSWQPEKEAWKEEETRFYMMVMKI